jgi:hypothetical protein
VIAVVETSQDLPSKEQSMAWFGVYTVVAGLVAVSIFMASDWFRQRDVAAPAHSGATSVLAGLLWPALLIGIAELAVVCCAGRRFRQAPQFEVVSSSLR